MTMTKKQRREKNQLDFVASLASVDANVSQLPQTIWKTDDKDMLFVSMESTYRSLRIVQPFKSEPVLTVLPQNYFTV